MIYYRKEDIPILKGEIDMAKTTKSFRLDNRIISDLERLSIRYEMNQTEVIEQAIRLVAVLTEYSELTGHENYKDTWKIKGYLRTCNFWKKE